MKCGFMVDMYGQKNAISQSVRHNHVKKIILNSCKNTSHKCDSNEPQKPVKAFHWQLPVRRYATMFESMNSYKSLQTVVVSRGLIKLVDIRKLFLNLTFVSRSILAACSIFFVSPTSLGALAMDTGRNVYSFIGPEVPQYISDYFRQAVEKIRQDIGQGEKTSRKFYVLYVLHG